MLAARANLANIAQTISQNDATLEQRRADVFAADYVLLADVLLDLPLTIVLTIIILRLSKRQRTAAKDDFATA